MRLFSIDVGVGNKISDKLFYLIYGLMTKAGFMSWGVSGTAAAVMGAAQLGSALIGSNAAQSAANTQAQAGLQAQNQLLQIGQNVSQLYQPYQQTGQLGLNSLNQMANSGYLTNQFSNADLNAQLAPNYAFQLQQGQSGQNAANNATGGLVGGNAQQALAQYNQNYASNAYQQAFNNYQSQRTNILNNANTLAGIGQNAVQGSANAQLGIGSNISNITQGIANAQAAGTVGSANAISGGLTGAGNLYALSNLLGNQNNQSNSTVYA
jgi:hypothetical protein